MFYSTCGFVRVFILAASCVLFYLWLHVVHSTCGFVVLFYLRLRAFILLARTCDFVCVFHSTCSLVVHILSYMHYWASWFYSTCGFVCFILLVASWFYSTSCGFVCFILLVALWFYSTCGFVCFILLADLWFYSTCGFVCLILATCGFVVYSTCGFVCFRLLSWLVVLTVVNGSAGMDLTSRLWCDRSCWYCFVASTTCYFFAAIESLLLRGLGSMLLMILFPYGYVFTSIQLCL